jgi:protein phosphatase
MRYALIADVHGCYNQLIIALKYLGFYRDEEGTWTTNGKYFVISLGDLNDYRHKEGLEKSSSIGCINTMMQLNQLGWSETVNSNHQDKFVRWLRGNRVTTTWGLEHTVEEFKRYASEGTREEVRQRLLKWLECRPNYYYFEEDGKKYVAAHAYYSPNTPNKEPKQAKDISIYGPRVGGGSNQRAEWWKYQAPHDRFVIVGHYHETWFLEGSAGIDGGAGEGGPLNIYIPSTKELISIEY